MAQAANGAMRSLQSAGFHVPAGQVLSAGNAPHVNAVVVTRCLATLSTGNVHRTGCMQPCSLQMEGCASELDMGLTKRILFSQLHE